MRERKKKDREAEQLKDGIDGNLIRNWREVKLYIILEVWRIYTTSVCFRLKEKC